MEQTTITHIFKNNTTHLSAIRQHRSHTNSLTKVDSNFTKRMVKYQSASTSTQIDMPANKAGWVWQAIMLIQRLWHQHPQHRICSLICFRTITSSFYEHLPPWINRYQWQLIMRHPAAFRPTIYRCRGVRIQGNPTLIEGLRPTGNRNRS